MNYINSLVGWLWRRKIFIGVTLASALFFFVWFFPFSDLSQFVTTAIARATGNQVYVQFESMDLDREAGFGRYDLVICSHALLQAEQDPGLPSDRWDTFMRRQDAARQDSFEKRTGLVPRLDRLVDLLPATFRADWGVRLRRNGNGTTAVLHGTAAAPEHLDWFDIARASHVDSPDENNVLAAAPLIQDEIVVIGRRGGPELLDSEVARLGHLTSLAVSIAKNA